MYKIGIKITWVTVSYYNYDANIFKKI